MHQTYNSFAETTDRVVGVQKVNYITFYHGSYQSRPFPLIITIEIKVIIIVSFEKQKQKEKKFIDRFDNPILATFESIEFLYEALLRPKSMFRIFNCTFQCPFDS